MRPGILTYHSLDGSGSVLSTHPERFRCQMESLVERQIRVAHLGEVLRGAPALAITFDDGYRSVAEEALPVLSELGLPATVFVVSGRAGSQNSWKNAPGVPVLPLMGWDTLRALDPGVLAVGSHSTAHDDLTRVPPSRLARDLRESRIEIEQRTGRAAPLFAYPYGRLNPGVLEAVRSEYELAVTTSLRYLSTSDDVHLLPRIDAYYLRSMERFRGVTAGRAPFYLSFRRTLRRLRGTE